MKACIAVMGAGGKTTAVRSLAHRLSGFSVLWTTTTHIYPAAPVSYTHLTLPTKLEV